MVSNDPNVGVAFALVAGAGAATAIGAAVVFFPSLVKLASRRILAGSLGLSAGVMTYVSFVEILQKALVSFGNAGHSDDIAYCYATVCFFGGVVFMLLIDFVVKCLSGHHGHEHHHHETEPVEDIENESCVSEDVMEPHCVCCSDDPVRELDELQKMAVIVQHEQDEHNKVTAVQSECEEHNESTDVTVMPLGDSNIVENVQQEDVENVKKSSVEDRASVENRRLIHMGINTAVAIGLHNFPEGLATFVAALNDARVGGVLAVAIGIHNIPEGLCVALPIYYATGNRRKAFLWALVSGLSEPLAALLGWAVLANSFSDTIYAVLFGVVAGMMVIISTKELLPTAHRYDPDDTVVTFSFIGGMCIMALSLVLFKL
jgi:zinc transporter, ZIP family